MDRDYGPMGLRKNFDYDEVLRAIGQQPLDLPAPKRVGLKAYEDIFFNNLINDQSSYSGDAKKGGFSHELPYEPPARPDVFYDARSDGTQTPFPNDESQALSSGFGPPPPPPPGGYGVFEGMFGSRPGNQPMQSGYAATQFEQPPVQVPVPPNAVYNTLTEEGQNPAPEPPGFFGELGQGFADSARSGAINQAGQMGAALGSQALQRVGGAVRDGAVRAFNWEDGLLWRAADEMGNVMLNPLSWRQNTAVDALRDPLLAAEAEAAMEGAELGSFGGPAGMLAGAALGAAAGGGIASLAFRDRESTERQDHFLDARSLNNQNASVRPLRPRFSTMLDERDRNPQPLRPRLWRHEETTPAYYNLAANDSDVDYAPPGRAQEPLRPTAAPAPMQPRMTAQGVIDGIAASQPTAPEQLRLQRRAARNRLPPDQGDSAPGSSQNILRPTAAPTAAFGLNSAPALPQPRRRNRGAPIE
jgi:hypothetical protein